MPLWRKGIGGGNDTQLPSAADHFELKSRSQNCLGAAPLAAVDEDSMTGNNTARKASHDEKAITFTLTLDEIDRILSENRRLRKQLEEREQAQKKYEQEPFGMLRQFSTIHGLHDFFDARSFELKLVFGFILTLCVLLLLYCWSSVLLTYLEHNYVISLYVKESTTPLTLPDIAICPFNRFNASYLKAMEIREELSQYLELGFGAPVMHTVQDEASYLMEQKLNELDDELQTFLRAKNITLRQLLLDASLDCKAFFAEPNFCDGVVEIMSSLGKCYRIRGKVQQTGGIMPGMHLVINLPIHLYHPTLFQQFNEGIVVKMADSGRGLGHDVIYVAPGEHKVISLKPTYFNFVNDPPRFECNVNAGPEYSKGWCIERCIFGPADDICNCTVASMLLRNDSSTKEACSAKQLFQCMHEFYKGSRERITMCNKMCSQPCKYMKYDITLSSAQFPSRMVRNLMSKHQWNELQNSIVLDFFFESLDVTFIKHMPSMTFATLIAAFGGHGSLLLGASVVSILRPLVYALAFIVRRIQQLCCRIRNA